MLCREDIIKEYKLDQDKIETVFADPDFLHALRFAGTDYWLREYVQKMDAFYGKNPVITGDLALFGELAKNGYFYEYLQLKLGLEKGRKGRQKAKQMAFEIFFSGVGIN